ncbi:hypothetical protein KZO96_04135 [Bifidobacterium pseudocatenulatum]|uniref:hypothetical protein n=1 Tax=Bifidobacterium TaxID=1678 RepID=UPI001CFC72B9|nr:MULTISPECIES: hypothetical protein [Bifidobacterium]MCB4887065.1 hypothetical protein [Bifidobacterium pseudocatenulatum]MDH7873059.1 hypothetical protein [Bifidobacterium catenulatum subsp. kashiwanohense]
MAHYDITHTCGHDERIELFGKTSERERRIEWLQERPCTECWKKERAAEAEARKNKEAAMIVEKLGNDAAEAINALSHATCTLEGSAKQVAWAEDIRAKCIAQAFDQARNTVARIPGKATAQQSAAFAARCNAIASTIANKTSAAWWIENRDDIAKAVIDEAIKAHA